MRRFRKEKVGEVILSCIGGAIMRSPKFSNLTFTGIEMSSDLKIANIMWALPLSPAEVSELAALSLKEILKKHPGIAETTKLLEEEKGQLRRVVGQEVKLRFTPELKFRLDESALRAAHIDMLLNEK